MKQITFIIALLFASLSYSQTEFKFVEDYRFENHECIITLKSLTQDGKNVILKVEMYPKREMSFMPLPISYESKIFVGNIPFKFIGYSFSNTPKDQLYSRIRGFNYRDDKYVGNWGAFDTEVGKVSYMYIVYEGYIPLGAKTFRLQDQLSPLVWENSKYKENNVTFKRTGWFPSEKCDFRGCQLEIPDPCQNIKLDETESRRMIDRDNDGITGIYEGVGSKDYKFACVKDDGKYYLIFLEYTDPLEWWHMGDVKAYLYATATAGMFRADWFSFFKYMEKKVFVFFDGSMMRVSINDKEAEFVKMYPTLKY